MLDPKEEAKKRRAERFGLEYKPPVPSAADALAAKKAARAARFGVDAAPITDEEKAKREARLKKFGPVTRDPVQPRKRKNTGEAGKKGRGKRAKGKGGKGGKRGKGGASATGAAPLDPVKAAKRKARMERFAQQ